MPLKPMYPANNPVTVQLTEELSPSAVLIPVTNVSIFPAGPNFATIGTEQSAETILYTGLDKDGGRLIGCQRGCFGTIAAQWPAGEFIYHAWSPDNANLLMENILTLEEEKAPTQEIARLDHELAELEHGVESLNTGKANLTAVEQLSDALEQIKLDKADASHILPLEQAITALEHAVAGLGGDGELDPSDIARLEAAIVTVNQTLESKADAADITRLDGELLTLSQSLESKADMAQLDALAPRIYPLSLTTEGWIETDNTFRQPVSIAAANAEQADFSAPMQVLAQLAQAGILIHLENDNGTVCAIASQRPDFDVTAQATVYKVVSGL